MPTPLLPRAATRRALLAAVAALAGSGLLPHAEDTRAKTHKRKHKRSARAEHNVRGKKAILCVDGVTRHVAKRARKRYLKQGATRGKCPGGCIPDSDSATCATADICGDVTNNCGQPVTCGCATGQLCCGGACTATVSWASQVRFGAEGSGGSQFDALNSLAVAADTLTIWVADTSNGRVSIWTRPNATSTAWSNATTFGSAGSGGSDFSYPNGVAISEDTLTAWIADTINNRISVWARPNASSTAWSNVTAFGSIGSGASNFTTPFSVDIAPDTLTAWIADAFNNRVSIWTRPDIASTVWANATTFGSGPGSGASQFNTPTGVALSEDTLTAWVADSGNNRISVWTRLTASSTSWSNQTTFGSSGSGASNFSSPQAVALSEDTLTAWVADTNNDRVSIWTRPTASSTAWANATTFGSGPGSGNDQFINPGGVAISPDGLTAWIADTGNDRVSIWAAVCPV
ncbi:MAG: hypothetical protein QM692_21155 [Thermomicrobiales bacterium]